MMQFFMMISLLLLPVTGFGAEVVKLKAICSAYADTAGAGVLTPEGVACGGSGAFVVSDTGHGRLQFFTLIEGGAKPGAEVKLPQLTYPQRVRMNSKGELIVLDGKQHKLLRLKPTGEFKGFLAAEGLPGGTWIPRSFALDRNDNVYVLDPSGFRVLVLSSEGIFQKQINYPPSDGFFSDVAVDNQGIVYLLNSVNGSLYSTGEKSAEFSLLVNGLKEYMSFPNALALDRKYIYVLDQNGSGLVVLGRDGAFQGRKLKMGWREGEVRFPADICVAESGEVFIADRGNNRVQIYSREMEQQK